MLDLVIDIVAELNLQGLISYRHTLPEIEANISDILKRCPKLPGKSLIALDESGSMHGEHLEVGSLLAAILYKSNDSMLMTFSKSARFENISLEKSPISIAQLLQKTFKIAEVNFNSVFATCGMPYDRIIFISDTNGWVHSKGVASGPPIKALDDYKKRTGADPFIYIFNLRGKEKTTFPDAKVCCLSLYESDLFGVIHKVEAVEI